MVLFIKRTLFLTVWKFTIGNSVYFIRCLLQPTYFIFVWWSRRPNFWSKLTSFQNRFCLMCNARALSDCTLIIIEPTVDYGFHETRVSKGAYHLAKKIRKFQLKVKWNSNFPGNPFRNCRLPAQVERNGGNFYHLLNRFQFSVSRSLLSAVNNYGKSNCKW